MLVLDRKHGQSVLIQNVYNEDGEPIEIVVTKSHNKLGFQADESVVILREELVEKPKPAKRTFKEIYTDWLSQELGDNVNVTMHVNYK